MQPKIAYEPHPVSPERKKELREQGFKIVDAIFAPEGQEPAKKQAKAKKQASDDAAGSSETNLT